MRYGFLLLAASLAVPAAAQTPTQAQSSAIRSACRGDYMNVCANVPTGGRAALECLEQHQNAVSSGCAAALAAVGGQAPAPVAAATPAMPPPTPVSPRQEAMMLRMSCRADYHRFCAGIPPGGGRILVCLRANAPALSPPCRSAMMSLRGAR